MIYTGSPVLYTGFILGRRQIRGSAQNIPPTLPDTPRHSDISGEDDNDHDDDDDDDDVDDDDDDYDDDDDNGA